MRVRAYHPRDFSRVLLLAADMHAESSFRRFAFSPHYVERLCAQFTENPDTAGFVAEESDGALTGMMAGAVQAFFFGPDRYAHDFVLYVAPHRRGGSAALRMVTAFATWARGRGAKELRVGHSTGVTPDKAHAFFGKLGFVESGKLYVRPI